MAAIFLRVRFLLTAYTVECREENGDMCLYIVQVTGRRMQTLAIFELSRIAALRRFPAGEKPDKKEGKLLSYTTAIFSESVILTVESATLTAPTLVRLEASEEFFSRLEPLIEIARAGQGYDPAAKYTEKTEDMDGERSAFRCDRGGHLHHRQDGSCGWGVLQVPSFRDQALF